MNKPIYYEVVWKNRLFYVHVILMAVILYSTALFYTFLALILMPIFMFLTLYVVFTSFYRIELYRSKIKIYYTIGAREVIDLNDIKEVYINPPFLKVESPFTVIGKSTISIITLSNKRIAFTSNSPQLIIQLITMLRRDLRRSYTRKITKPLV